MLWGKDMIKDIQLRDMLNSESTLIMPDAFDSISAKIIEYAGFKAVQCSGYSFSIVKGLKGENEIDLVKNLDMTKEIVEAVKIPVMGDGEDGYSEQGDISEVIKAFIDTGISGINIEDQNHYTTTTNLSIIDECVMVEKIKSAIRTKKVLGRNNFIINSRTDAILSISDRHKALCLAIERANKYLETGADICFIPYIKTVEEIKLLSKEISGPISIALGLPYNIDKISIGDCIELGIARVSLPTYMIFSSMQSMINNLNQVLRTGKFDEVINSKSILSDMEILDSILKRNY